MILCQPEARPGAVIAQDIIKKDINFSIGAND